MMDNDEDLQGLDEEEKRKVIRQKRNRLSALLSRDRKKNYVAELEQKVQKLIGQNAQLTSCCKKLLQENRELRTAVAIYRGTSLQALGGGAASGGIPSGGLGGVQALGAGLQAGQAAAGQATAGQATLPPTV